VHVGLFYAVEVRYFYLMYAYFIPVTFYGILAKGLLNRPTLYCT